MDFRKQLWNNSNLKKLCKYAQLKKLFYYCTSRFLNTHLFVFPNQQKWLKSHDHDQSHKVAHDQSHQVAHDQSRHLASQRASRARDPDHLQRRHLGLDQDQQRSNLFCFIYSFTRSKNTVWKSVFTKQVIHFTVH